ncbi:MAG: acyl-ACP--UDP-N-acetylglucosamine O-acyltransferase [Pirellulaceae bacterium]|nr:acyl-ACP--UDP-N-acetylglucosamine O-acyltransferase [Planctomycetales bacterium]
MFQIHPSAVVDSKAQLGNDVCIGPFCWIEADVVIGDGCQLSSRVVIRHGTTLGSCNRIADGAVLGGEPQHARATPEQGRLRIGRGNTIREHATLHRALQRGSTTVVGDENLIMVNAHVGHDCVVGNNTIIVNNVMLGGHVQIEDRAYVSGGVGVHQFCRIGAYAMVGGPIRIVQDVPPFVTVDGKSGRVVGINTVGLRRGGFNSEEIFEIKRAYRAVYRSGLRWVEVLDVLGREFSTGPAARFYQFMSQGNRGFVQERRQPKSATIRLYRPEDDDSSANQVNDGAASERDHASESRDRWAA